MQENWKKEYMAALDIYPHKHISLINEDLLDNAVNFRSRDSSVGIATSFESRGSIPGGSKTFFLTLPPPDRLWYHPVSYAMGAVGPPPGLK
jgi:hypothetical protein